MTAIALPAADLFSVVTTADRRGPAPWQALLDLPRFGHAHVDYAAGTPAQRNLWATRLDEAVRAADKPVLLVASGESCFATAWWARLSPASYVRRVAGALLFDPLRGSDNGTAERFASPPTALPFPTAIVRGRGREAQVEALASGWGSGFLELAAEDRQEGGRAWQQAHALIVRATARMIDRRLRVAEALGVEP